MGLPYISSGWATGSVRGGLAKHVCSQPDWLNHMPGNDFRVKDKRILPCLDEPILFIVISSCRIPLFISFAVCLRSQNDRKCNSYMCCTFNAQLKVAL